MYALLNSTTNKMLLVNIILLPTAILLLIANWSNAINPTANISKTYNQSLHVPLFLSNITLNGAILADQLATTTTATTMTTNASIAATVPIVVSPLPMSSSLHKVPLRRNVSDSATATFLQTPASVFFANYNSQQNVMLLVRNVDARLRNIRNVEMRVATIQEIFDSMHFSSSSTTISGVNKNESRDKSAIGSTMTTLEADLQIFSRRLAKKLQKAKHIVLDLRDFLRYNITNLLMQHIPLEYNEDSEEDDDDDDDDDGDINKNNYDDSHHANNGNDDDDDENVDIEIDELDSIMGNTNFNIHRMHLYLNTLIESCQSTAATYSVEQNYNKQQIQILNFLKTEQQQQQLADEIYTNDLNEYSFEANSYIAEKLLALKTTLSKMDFFDVPTSMRNAPNNAKLKFLGNHFKHIYFLSRSDHASDRLDNYYYDLHFRHLYVSSIRSKFVLLLLDVGSGMTSELLELTKTFVSNILQLLSNTDYISIITVADEAKLMVLENYPSIDAAGAGLYVATREHKDEIINFINSLPVSHAQTNHSLGFEYSFRVLQQLQNVSLITIENPIVFAYVTRGLLTNLSDTDHVLTVIGNGQRQLKQPIVINTCAVVLDEKRIMYEKQFLSDISTQNYSKYKIKVDDWYDITQADSFIGKLFVFTKVQPSTLMRASTAIFESAFEERYLAQTLEVHTPVVDANSKDVIVSITHAVAPYGVVGVNLYLADLIEDIINYHHNVELANKQEYSYAFLIDRAGITLAHPAFPRPIAQSEKPFPVDIGFLENSTDFSNIRRRMLHEESGNITTTVYFMNNRKSEIRERTYYWQSVLSIYIVCLVMTSKKDTISTSSAMDNLIRSSPPLHIPTNIPLNIHRFNAVNNDNLQPFHMVHNSAADYGHISAAELLYHRLDLIPPPNGQTCRYFRQVATMDAVTLFLSSSAFESPFTFLHNNRISTQHTQMRTVESIMAYIKDTTGLLANPGLRPQIRDEVNALYNAMQQLRKRHQDARGTLKNYIVRRYIATVNGVLQVYPGCLLSSNYDPTRRPWFHKAMQQPGKIITTEPYLDAGGAGYIVTIAHTIFEGKSNALHSVERDQPVAIVALDLPYAYFYRMILDTTPLCQLPNIKCLLFENEGYLIAHPSMLEVSSPLKNPRRPHEHLTHKESYLANDILNHKMLVRKLACANYQNRTLQRYYAFNTSLTDILTNVVHGERTKYGIALIRGSNVFAAVLNSTCDGGAFCPCSTISRDCLNCNRMEQMDCECPCECPMELDMFEEGVFETTKPIFSNYTQQYAYCKPQSEHFIALPSISNAPNLLSTACMSIGCDVFGSQSECLAVMGCEWCQQDLDGNAFTSAFCTSQTACFNGVLSSLTPYGDLDDVDVIAAHGYNPGQKQSSYSAFGPIGGAVIVLGIVIGFAIYCYRHNLDTQSQDQFYIDSMQEENYGLPLSRFNFDDCQANDDPPGGGYDHPSAQRNLIHPADISPYHMSSGSSYRRPPNGESDHGYSTMTPHEDSSDHQCFTLAEPLLLSDKRQSKSDTMSISTSISSPTNRHHNHHHQHSQQQQQQHYHNPYQTQLPPPPTTSAAGGKEISRYTSSTVNSPREKFHPTHSPARVYGETTLPLNNDSTNDATQTPPPSHPPLSPHYILAPVTVHRHMETSES